MKPSASVLISDLEQLSKCKTVKLRDIYLTMNTPGGNDLAIFQNAPSSFFSEPEVLSVRKDLHIAVNNLPIAIDAVIRRKKSELKAML